MLLGRMIVAMLVAVTGGVSATGAVLREHPTVTVSHASPSVSFTLERAVAPRASRSQTRRPMEGLRTIPSKTCWNGHVGTIYDKCPAKPQPKPKPAIHHRRHYANLGTIWDQLAQCESTGDWSYNGPSGYDGGLQFAPSTWTRKKFAGYPAYAWQATREQQIAVAKKILAESGWGQWPACSRKLHLR